MINEAALTSEGYSCANTTQWHTDPDFNFLSRTGSSYGYDLCVLNTGLSGTSDTNNQTVDGQPWTDTTPTSSLGSLVVAVRRKWTRCQSPPPERRCGRRVVYGSFLPSLWSTCSWHSWGNREGNQGSRWFHSGLAPTRRMTDLRTETEDHHWPNIHGRLTIIPTNSSHVSDG